MSREQFAALVADMPKTELHTHLEGAVRPETIVELAPRYQVALPAGDVAGLRRAIEMKPGETLLDFLKKFEPFRFIFDHPESLRRAAFEMVEDDARENVVYTEIRINPVKHEDQLSIEGVLDAVLDGMQEAARKYGVQAHLIVSLNRSYPLESALRVARAAAERKGRGVVGMDLAGDEVHFPVEKFKPVFDYAAEQQLHITIHAGEAAGPESIRHAIEDCHAERIGHGVRLGEDPAVLQEVSKRGVVLEMCPTSNLLINVVKDLRTYPLPAYRAAGVPVTVSTDDRHIFGLTLSGEYLALAEATGMSLQELEELSLNGARACFAEDREDVVADLQRRMDEFEARWEGRLNSP